MIPISDHGSSMSTAEVVTFNEEQRAELFMKDQNPSQLFPSITINILVCREWNFREKDCQIVLQLNDVFIRF
jgi:hypothetical protein